ncbi:SDR family NAD(P)-dependent oxidoreductase [Microlunatus speluncae]|uniref:SDR family NAD(P)-dependent oxidoreductase n=1 Tax=Microlunatus speluncae TaxID=2594267 RepID=UPI0012667568|nr:SDR family NAD(P)-dependent oxidoreductase [Microlunatus speluncae]
MSTWPTDRTVIVTGATSPRGIGRSTASFLAERGWNIGLIDLDQAECDDFAAELIERHHVKAFGAAADVADEQQARAAVDAIEGALPQLVALANIAGVSSPVGYLELTSEEWHRVININLHGVHYVTKRAVETMVEHRLGRIVSISSVSAQRGGGTFSKTPYSVAKAGLIGLTRSLARELGGYRITVNAVSPGPIDTDIMGGTLSEERKELLAQDLVLDRVGRTADVAAGIGFLISEEAGFISGQTLNIDGGLYMH